MSQKTPSLPPETIVPKHLAIICDGNRRWARARNLPNFRGHSKGFDTTPEIARACRDFGIHTLTFWAFSTENWDRSPAEIDFLMKKYEWFVDKHLAEAKKEGVRIVHLGRKDRLPKSLVKKIAKAEEETRNNEKYILNIALDYGGRDEILRAMKKVVDKGIAVDRIDEDAINACLDTGDQPYPFPDLLIRPSGEQRTSGMFCWQGAYTETCWSTSHFPDMTAEIIREAVIDFSKRRRRFGGNDSVPKIKLDPKKAAEYEVGWWRAHNEKNNQETDKLLKKWVTEVYGINGEDSVTMLGKLKEAGKGHDKKDWKLAEGRMEEFYQMVKDKTGLPFCSKVVANLEVGYWKKHDELEDVIDKSELTKILTDLLGETFRLSELQAERAGYFKTMATVAHDRAEAETDKKRSEEYWRETKEYLEKSYLALRHAAS